MGITLDGLTVDHAQEGDLTSLHVRLIPMMSSTLVEIVGYRGWQFGSPRLHARASIPYSLLTQDGIGTIIWQLGDELRTLGAELSEM